MTPWAERLLRELCASDARARALAEGLTYGQLNWRPTRRSWSIGQCLDHLCVASRVYGAAIAAALERQPRTPVEAITPGWFGRTFVTKYTEPVPRVRRIPAPDKIRPVREVDLAVLDRFHRSNEESRALVRRAADYDVNRLRFVNPFVPFVRFSVGTGLEIISAHERRHLLQAERVKTSAGFPRF
ncbi:MAG: DinB family protein [Deltaproteobacteria bacterium]